MSYSPIVCTKEVVQKYGLLSKESADSVFCKLSFLVGDSGQEPWANIILLVRLFEGCKEEYAKDCIL